MMEIWELLPEIEITVNINKHGRIKETRLHAPDESNSIWISISPPAGLPPADTLAISLLGPISWASVINLLFPLERGPQSYFPLNPQPTMMELLIELHVQSPSHSDHFIQALLPWAAFSPLYPLKKALATPLLKEWFLSGDSQCT